MRWQHPSHLIIPYTLVNIDFRYLSGSGMDNSEAFYQSLCAAFNLLMAEGEQQPKLMSVGLHSRIPAIHQGLIHSYASLNM